MRNIVALLLPLLVLVVLPSTAQASHYPLDAVSFIPKEHSAALQQAGFSETKDLLNGLLTPKARKAVAEKAQIDEDTLLQYAQLCDLLRIRGIGPKMAQVIYYAGFKTVAELEKAKPAMLAQAMKKANQKHRISELLPQEESLVDWINQAKKLPNIVK